ncbi:MAG: apolipoprotein N-acyltransferase [Alphaproteobacteria bacterium]
MIRTLATIVGGLAGWRRHGLALLLGVLAAAAQPPVGAAPLLLVAFPALVWLIDGSRSWRGAALVGWSFGSGHFATALYWVGHAFLVDPERFGWMLPFAIIGLGVGLGAFVALAAGLTHAVSRPGPARVAALAGAWTVAEMLRGWLFTGFPWGLAAYAWSDVPAMMQVAALVGAYGVSLLTVLIAATPALADRRFPAAALGLLALVWAGGAVRLQMAGAVGDLPLVPGVTLRLVQANIDQTLKWRPSLRETNFLRQIELSRSPGIDSVTHVIWPETASIFSLDHDATHRAIIATAAPPGGAVITGAPRLTPPGVSPLQVWNSLLAIDHDGTLVAVYDKVHLVPFGEYMPLRSILPFDKLTVGAIDFSAGPGMKTLTVSGLPPFSPLICYEAIFPGKVVDATNRPDWLLNLTNDAWFGMSAGPHQHFASTRWRAVEEGLPLVRVAVTGISGVVDPFGRVLRRLDLGEMGVLDAPLPRPLVHPTPYARWGDGPVLLLASFLLGTAIAALRRG